MFYTEIMQPDITNSVIKKFTLLADSFQKTLYSDDIVFLENLRKKNLQEKEIKKYEFWEWPQGVGLYGFWKYFEFTRNTHYFNILREYYDRQMEIGFPERNVNTTAPLLPLSFLAEYTGEGKYMDICSDWAEWIMYNFPRTEEGGFQHITSDSVNDQELWDDTLFMAVLFLANIGRILKKTSYCDEAVYQFMVHAKYLADRKTGLWYHGWTFNGRNNFAGAFWGRGNCWITAAIPELFSMVQCTGPSARFLTELLKKQVQTLATCQDSDGFWHTLIDDRTSYREASATSGFSYGILRAANMGLIDSTYRSCAEKALEAILGCISDDGIVQEVSYGTPMGRETKDFYKNIPIRPMPYGQALAMLFLLEIQKTIKGGGFV